MNRQKLAHCNIEDLRLLAKKRLPRGIFEYIDGAAEDGIAKQHNRDVYRSLKIKNRVLKDVSKRSTATEIFGKKIAMAYAISPTASAGLMSDGGEVALARAAARMGIPCTVATNSLTPMEEIVEAGGGNLWFQLYMWVDLKLRMAFVDRVKAAGFDTLLVTVDGSVGANREHDRKNGFSMPLIYTPRLIAQILANPGWCMRVLAPQYMKRGAFRKANYPPEMASKLTDKLTDHELTKPDTQCWDDIKRIRDIWPGYMAKIDIVHVPYKGGGPALNDLVGGHVDIFFNPIPAMLPLVKGGRVKALAVTSEKRFAGLPDVPTMGESGLPQIGSTVWYGALAPARTPAGLIKRLHADFIDALKAPDVQESLRSGGAETVGDSPQQFAQFLRRELESARKLLQVSGAKRE